MPWCCYLWFPRSERASQSLLKIDAVTIDTRHALEQFGEVYAPVHDTNNGPFRSLTVCLQPRIGRRKEAYGLVAIGGEGKSSSPQERRFVTMTGPPVPWVIRQPGYTVNELVEAVVDFEDDSPLAVIRGPIITVRKRLDPAEDEAGQMYSAHPNHRIVRRCRP